MRRLFPLLLVAAAVLAGCGGAGGQRAKATLGFVCHQRTTSEGQLDGQAGECHRQELEAKGIRSAPPRTVSGRAQGIDISRWQPFPSFTTLYREGIRFAIIQTNAGACRCNPYFLSQVKSAHAAGLKVGVYVFVENASSAAQADVLGQVAEPVRSLISLGAWVDTEVPGAYERGCPIVRRLYEVWHFHIAGIYASNGNWPGYVCGYNWPAKWGGGASPLPGYSYASMKVRQWCGTCYLGGNSGQIDRDEDLGVIALATPPLTHAQLRIELYTDYRHRTSLRRLLGRYGCTRRRHRHEHLGRRCRVWFHAGDVVNLDIVRLHRKRIY